MRAFNATLARQDFGYAAVSLAAGVVLAVLTARISPLSIAAVTVALILSVAFLASPWVTLLSVLLIRASTDLSYAILGGGQGTGSLLPALPNIGLILALIVAGGLVVIRRGGFIRLPAFHFLALLLMTGIVGVIRAPQTVRALSEWLPLAGILVVYFLSANLPNKKRDIDRTVGVILLSSLVPMAMGVYQLVSSQGLYLADEQAIRISGTFVHPNAFGVYLVLLFGLLLARFTCRVGGRRAVDLGFLAVTSVLVVGTYMRGAWVGAAAVILIIGLLRARWLLIVFPVLAVIVVLTIPSVTARASNPLGSGSFTDRLGLWSGTYAQWHEATAEGEPWLGALLNRLGGLGPGAVDPLTARFRASSFAAHNDYLRLLVEYGVFGVVLYLSIVIALLKLGYTTYHESRAHPLGFIPLAFLAVTVAFAVMSLTDNVFGSTQNQVYYWALAGLSVATGRISVAPPPPEDEPASHSRLVGL